MALELMFLVLDVFDCFFLLWIAQRLQGEVTLCWMPRGPC